MVEKFEKFIDQNIYSIILKILGVGFNLLALSIVIFKGYIPMKSAIGMCIGVAFLALGEIINLLDIISKK